MMRLRWALLTLSLARKPPKPYQQLIANAYWQTIAHLIQHKEFSFEYRCKGAIVIKNIMMTDEILNEEELEETEEDVDGVKKAEKTDEDDAPDSSGDGWDKEEE